jgi:hypothetical protein
MPLSFDGHCIGNDRCRLCDKGEVRLSKFWHALECNDQYAFGLRAFIFGHNAEQIKHTSQTILGIHALHVLSPIAIYDSLSRFCFWEQHRPAPLQGQNIVFREGSIPRNDERSERPFPKEFFAFFPVQTETFRSGPYIVIATADEFQRVGFCVQEMRRPVNSF